MSSKSLKGIAHRVLCWLGLTMTGYVDVDDGGPFWKCGYCGRKRR